MAGEVKTNDDLSTYIGNKELGKRRFDAVLNPLYNERMAKVKEHYNCSSDAAILQAMIDSAYFAIMHGKVSN